MPNWVLKIKTQMKWKLVRQAWEWMEYSRLTSPILQIEEAEKTKIIFKAKQGSENKLGVPVDCSN